MLGLIHTFLNLVAPPFTFFSLCVFLPPFYLFKSFSYVLSSIFSENLKGKVVVITGTSSGIGEHLAYEYAKRGARLALVGRRENALREVVNRASDFGSPDVLMIRADVSKVEDCKRIVDDTMTHYGRQPTTGADPPGKKRVKSSARVHSSYGISVLVTGAAGFVGTHRSATLKRRKDGVLGLDCFNDYYDSLLKKARQALLEQSGVFIVESDT